MSGLALLAAGKVQRSKALVGAVWSLVQGLPHEDPNLIQEGIPTPKKTNPPGWQ